MNRTWQTLEGQQRIYIVPTSMECGLTGVASSWQDKSGAITLLYSDQTEESRLVDEPPQIYDFPSIFALVSWVQIGRESNL